MGRIDKLRAAMPTGFGALLVTDLYNRHYLSGFPSSAGSLVVTETTATLYVDSRYYEAACAVANGVDVVLAEQVHKQIATELAQSGLAQLYLEQSTTLAELDALQADLPGVKMACDAALSDALQRLRSVKDAMEIEAIETAQAITDAAFSSILAFIRPGRSEREIAAELEYTMRKLGADDFAFPTICLSGPNTSKPHGVPGDRTVQNGEFLLLDFGAKKNGYCSDMTRTVAVGAVDEAKQNVYAAVLEAHLAAVDAAHAGISGIALDKVARDSIAAAGYGGRFGHGLGHSLGLEIHEEPRASTSCGTILLPGTLMTIEPGIYLPGSFGVRIENMVVISEHGCKDLTASKRTLIVL